MRKPEYISAKGSGAGGHGAPLLVIRGAGPENSGGERARLAAGLLLGVREVKKW